MKYDVTIARFGSATIEAESPEDAMAKARKLGTGEIAWSSDWEPTDADPSGDDGGAVPERRRPIAFFDMDGTIAAPLFRNDDGMLVDGFQPQDWIRFCNDRGSASYELCAMVHPVLDFAKRLKDAGYELHILTVALSEGERAGKTAWKHGHPEVDGLFDDIIFAGDVNEKLDEVKTAGPEGILVDDDLLLLLRAKESGATTIHVSQVYAGTADKLAGLYPKSTDYIADAAKEAANCRNVCFMTNGKTEAQRAFWTWHRMGAKNTFLLTSDMPRRELEQAVKAIKELQDSGSEVRVACTPVLETGVNLDFEDFYREAADESHLAQASGRHNRHGRYEPKPMRIFRPDGTMELRGRTPRQVHDGGTDPRDAAADAKAFDMGDAARAAEALAGAAGEALADAKNAVADMARQAAGSDAAMSAKGKLSEAMRKAAAFLDKR